MPIADNESVLQRAWSLFQQNRLQEAEQMFSRVCDLDSANASAWFMLGATRHRQDKIDGALAAFDNAARLDPANVQALSASAAMLSLLDRQNEALETYRRAFALSPRNPELLTNIGIVLEKLADLPGALQHYERALALQPGFPAALMNRGALLNLLKRYREALENNDRFARLYPELDDAHFNRAETLLALEKYQEALAACERAIALNPRHGKAHFDRGLALSMLERFPEAQAAFDVAKSIDPRQAAAFLKFPEQEKGEDLWPFLPQRVFLHRCYEEIRECNWTRLRDYVRQMETIVRSTTESGNPIWDKALAFQSLALPVSPDTRFTLVKSISDRIAQVMRPKAFGGAAPARTREGRIRIGYVSPDYRAHPTAFLSRRLFGLHDRARFEVYGYSLHPGDGSAVRRDIEDGCDHFVELSELNDLQAAERIRSDGIQILVDLAGYTTFCRTEILALRPAPIQVNYLGFPGTMGAGFIDYRFTDRIATPPEDEKYWTEKLVYLPHTFMITNNRQAIAEEPLERGRLGLPEKGFVFCCFNNSYKIEPVVFGIWMSLLGRLPGSVLWLFKADDAVEENLRGEAARRGVSPERLVFAPFMEHERHLARYRLADLFLDTLWCGAHTTACDALWAGLPVLTCPGLSFASRGAASMMCAAGLPEMVTRNLQEYEDRANHLATHPEELARIRGRLAHGRLSSRLFDTERRVREFEAAYRIMWERHCDGLPPEPFAVPAAS